jgi:protein-tyrosine phosphatase
MSNCIEYNSAENPRDVVVDVVSRLAEGEIMQTRIDIGPVLAGWSQRPGVIERMAGNLVEEQKLCLCVTGYHQAADYIESISATSRRLMTRGWPGSLQLELPLDQPFGLLEALPGTVQQRLVSGRRLRLSCPKSGFIRDLQKLLSGPLVLTSPLRDDKLTVSSGKSEPKSTASPFDFVVETEVSTSADELSVVEVTGDSWQILQSGGMTSTDLKRMTGSFYLFICTGNTCRSPMAEGLFRKMLSEKLQCEVAELANRGYQVASAGIAAGIGAPASPEAVQLLLSEGIDISRHQSRQLTEELLDQADLIVTMTRGHRDAILMSRPDVEHKIRMLSPEGRDISDPIGGGMAEYESCKSEIQTHLQKLLDEIDVSPS